jgi:hypothetical protein
VQRLLQPAALHVKIGMLLRRPWPKFGEVSAPFIALVIEIEICDPYHDKTNACAEPELCRTGITQDFYHRILSKSMDLAVVSYSAPADSKK